MIIIVLMAIWAFMLFVVPMGARQKAIHRASLSIGSELIRTTNSSRLGNIGPDLQAQLASLLGAPTQVSTVLFGDEPPPIGDGRARCRLVLTNAIGQGLLIRLGKEHATNHFRVLGFHSISQKP